MTNDKNTSKINITDGLRVPTFGSLDWFQLREHRNLNPQIIDRFNITEIHRILNDYHSGTLHTHDNTLGEIGLNSGGYGKWLNVHCQAKHIREVLSKMERMRPRPLPDMPPERGWWVLVLDWWRYYAHPSPKEGYETRQQERKFPIPDHLPEPIEEDARSALVIFMNHLYRVVFESAEEKARRLAGKETVTFKKDGFRFLK